MAANFKYKFCIFSLILIKVSNDFYNTIYSYMFQSLLIMEIFSINLVMECFIYHKVIICIIMDR